MQLTCFVLMVVNAEVDDSAPDVDLQMAAVYGGSTQPMRWGRADLLQKERKLRQHSEQPGSKSQCRPRILWK